MLNANCLQMIQKKQWPHNSRTLNPFADILSGERYTELFWELNPKSKTVSVLKVELEKTWDVLHGVLFQSEYEHYYWARTLTKDWIEIGCLRHLLGKGYLEKCERQYNGDMECDLLATFWWKQEYEAHERREEDARWDECDEEIMRLATDVDDKTRCCKLIFHAIFRCRIDKLPKTIHSVIRCV